MAAYEAAGETDEWYTPKYIFDAIGDELKDLSGLYRRQPRAAFAMLLFLLSLGGTPPTAGFMGKFRLFGAAIESGHVWLAGAGVLNSVLSLYYYLRIVMFMYQWCILRCDTLSRNMKQETSLYFLLSQQ